MRATANRATIRTPRPADPFIVRITLHVVSNMQYAIIIIYAFKDKQQTAELQPAYAGSAAVSLNQEVAGPAPCQRKHLTSVNMSASLPDGGRDG